MCVDPTNLSVGSAPMSRPHESCPVVQGLATSIFISPQQTDIVVSTMEFGASVIITDQRSKATDAFDTIYHPTAQQADIGVSAGVDNFTVIGSKQTDIGVSRLTVRTCSLRASTTDFMITTVHRKLPVSLSIDTAAEIKCFLEEKLLHWELQHA